MSELRLNHQTLTCCSCKVLFWARCFGPTGRNYLEHVAGSISGWTREEELKRQAAEVKHSRPAERPEGARTFPDVHVIV